MNVMDGENDLCSLSLKLHILVHISMNVTSVEKRLATSKPSVWIREPTVVRKPTNVPNVGKVFPTNQNSLHIREAAEVRKPVAATNGDGFREGCLNRRHGNHTKEKSGGNSNCDKTLSQKTNLSTPDTILAGEKPYKC